MFYPVKLIPCLGSPHKKLCIKRMGPNYQNAEPKRKPYDLFPKLPFSHRPPKFATYVSAQIALLLNVIIIIKSQKSSVNSGICLVQYHYGLFAFLLLRIQAFFIKEVFMIRFYSSSIILSLVVLVFGNSIHQAAMVHMPFLAVITGMILRLKDVVSIAFLTLVFMLLYKFVPNRKAKLLSQAPGAVFSSVCWYLFSIGFSLYVTYTPGLSNMYGSLTTIILAMLWLYFCMYIILLGAEINSYFEEQFRMVSRYRSLLHEEKKNKTEK